MYDDNGKWIKQRVYESRLQNGQRGLFTQGRLVMHLHVDEDAAEVARRNDFDFDGSSQEQGR